MSKTTNHLQLRIGFGASARVASRWMLLALLLFGSAFAAVAQQGQSAPQTKTIEPCTDQPSNKTPLKRVSAVTTKDDARTAASQTLVDESIPEDPALENIIAPYSEKVRSLAKVIGKLDGELKKERLGAGSLGNFVTEGLRAQASKKLGQPVHAMVTNAGGMRKSTIAPGDLRASDIFELLPFENALVKLEVTGQQLLRILEVVLEGGEAQSGARITYRLDANNHPEFISAKLVGSDGRETEIDPKKIYTIVTIDYLLSLKSGDFTIIQENRGATPLRLTMRDAIMEYVKSETAAGRSIKPPTDKRYVLVGSAAKDAGEATPQ